MKRCANYFNDLFHKYDIWVIIIAIGSIAFAFHRQKLFIGIPQMMRLSMVAFPGLVALANFGNFKNKVNLLDVCSIIFMAIYLYFSIKTPEGFSIMMAVVLFLQVCVKAFVYQHGEEEVNSPSKAFYSKLNYYIPLLPVVLVGFGLAFVARYIYDAFPKQAVFEFNRAIGVCSTLVPLVYLVCVRFADSKKVNLLDYIYVMLCCFLLGLIFINLPKKLDTYQLYTFIFPALCLCIRAHSFEGEVVTEKKKYFSALFARFHVILPIACGIAGAYLISRSTLNDIFKIEQGLFLLLGGISCIVFIVAALCLRQLKASTIKAFDYLLLFPLSVVFFSVIYLLSIILGFYGDKVKTTVFGDTLSIVGIVLLAVSLVACAVLFFIRYKNYKNASVEESQEDEVIEEAKEEVVEESAEEEAPVVVPAVEKLVVDFFVLGGSDVAAIQVDKDSKITEPEQAPVKENYEFGGWYQEEECVNPWDFEHGIVDKNTTLYAKWIEVVEEAPVEEPQQEVTEVVAEEAPQQEEVTEPVVVAPVEEDNATVYVILYNKSMRAKVSMGTPVCRNYYKELKKYLLSYGLKSRMSWGCDTIYLGRVPFAKFSIRGKTLSMNIALDPTGYEGGMYEDCSDKKKFEEVPLRIKIRSNRTLKLAKKAIDLLASTRGYVKKEETSCDIEPVRTFKGNLQLGLIKKTNSRRAVSLSSISADDLENLVISEEAAESVKKAIVDKKLSGKKEIVNLDTISKNFEANEVVSLTTLIDKRLIPSGANAVKCLARGTLDKPLHFELDDYSNDAIKMILVTGGTIE